jgi:4-oxalocrotonate tautomerase
MRLAPEVMTLSSSDAVGRKMVSAGALGRHRITNVAHALAGDRMAGEEHDMPFVNIKILRGHPAEAKQKITEATIRAINENTRIPEDQIWVVFEEVEAEDWFVGRRSVAEIKKGRS